MSRQVRSDDGEEVEDPVAEEDAAAPMTEDDTPNNRWAVELGPPE